MSCEISNISICRADKCLAHSKPKWSLPVNSCCLDFWSRFISWTDLGTILLYHPH
ncbi:unnamed protein product [Musa acuminata var. zebrina]